MSSKRKFRTNQSNTSTAENRTGVAADNGDLDVLAAGLDRLRQRFERQLHGVAAARLAVILFEILAHLAKQQYRA